MDSPAAAKPTTQNSHWRFIAGLSFGLALLAYGVVVAQHTGAYAGGSDSSGYLNSARLLRDGNFRIAQRGIEGLEREKISTFSYIPLGFIPIGERDMAPTYPLGLSSLIIAVSWLTGWENAPGVTMWLHAMAGVILIFALAREAGLSRALAGLGALILGLSPLYLFMSIQAMSDAPSLTWCIAAIYFAWRSRRQGAWAIAAGLSVAVAVFVRPSNFLVILPVALSLGLDWRRWLGLGIGGAPGVVLLAFVNQELYGKIFASGYGAVTGGFALVNAPPALANYAQWLPVLLTPALLVVLALPWFTRRESARFVIVCAAWVAVFFGFYAFYYHTHETWWYLRFVLPAFPALVLLIIVTLRGIAARWTAKVRWTTGLMTTAMIAAWAMTWSHKLNALDSGRGERVYPDAAKWAVAHLPPNAVVMAMQASGALLFYTDLTLVRWDQYDGKNFGLIEEACGTAGRPIYAVLFPFELEEVMAKKRLPGRWTQIGAVRDVTFWRHEPERPAVADR